jgi:hypothetical protein
MDKYLVAKNQHFKRFGILDVKSVIETIKFIHDLPQTNKPLLQIEVFGQLTSVASNTKLLTFVKHGTKCVSCGIEGVFFAVELNLNEPEKPCLLNLYAIDELGNEVLMNMDHRLPRARGGADCVDNMQTMCQPCNLLKGCKKIFIDGGVSKKSLKLEHKRLQRLKN